MKKKAQICASVQVCGVTDVPRNVRDFNGMDGKDLAERAFMVGVNGFDRLEDEDIFEN